MVAQNMSGTIKKKVSGVIRYLWEKNHAATEILREYWAVYVVL